MAANTLGSVRRTDRPDAVILHVAGSRRALWAAVRLIGILILATATIALAAYLADGGIVLSAANMHDAVWRVTWTCGGVILIWWYVARHIPPLLRTARQRVTIEIDARRRRLEIDTGGGSDGGGADGLSKQSWPSAAIADILVAPRLGGSPELRIVPAAGRSATLFYGLPQHELEFIAATMRDALRLTARDAAEVEVDDLDEAARRDDEGNDHGKAAASVTGHAPALDYALALPPSVAIDRAQAGVTIYVAPLSVATYLAERWPLIAAMFGVIAVWGLATDTKRDVVLVGVALALLVALANAAACLTRTTIQLGRTRLSRLTATPLGTIDEGWSLRSVRDVIVTLRPPTVELRLAGGETAILANPATADEAEASAAALRRALLTYARERDAAALE